MKMITTRIRAAIFDMDGTMFDTERLYMEGWIKGLTELGYPPETEMLFEFHGRSPEDNARIFEERYGVTEPYWKARPIRDAYTNEFLKQHGVPVKPGLFEILRVLKDNGILIAAATSSRRDRAEKLWEDAGVTPYLDCYVCRDDITKSKPDPDIFLKAAGKTGAGPSECVVFEDALNGLTAARAAGCHTIYVPDLEGETDSHRSVSDLIMPSLSDAAEYLMQHDFRM